VWLALTVKLPGLLSAVTVPEASAVPSPQSIVAV